MLKAVLMITMIGLFSVGCANMYASKGATCGAGHDCSKGCSTGECPMNKEGGCSECSKK